MPAAPLNPPEVAAREGRPSGCARTRTGSHSAKSASPSHLTPLLPGPSRQRVSAVLSFPFSGLSPSLLSEQEEKLRPRVGTCAELQAGAVTAHAAAARGGRRARAVPDDCSER